MVGTTSVRYLCSAPVALPQPRARSGSTTSAARKGQVRDIFHHKQILKSKERIPGVARTPAIAEARFEHAREFNCQHSPDSRRKFLFYAATHLHPYRHRAARSNQRVCDFILHPPPLFQRNAPPLIAINQNLQGSVASRNAFIITRICNIYFFHNISALYISTYCKRKECVCVLYQLSGF